MFKRVDLDEVAEVVTGFSYMSDSGIEEVVLVKDISDGEVVVIKDSLRGVVKIFDVDIPKLIKALNAAYKYKQGEMND